MTQQVNTFAVAIQTPRGRVVKAFDVCIKDDDVYVNYSDRSTPEAHKSYHASGQQHMKIGGRYVEWTGGDSGRMEPMKLFRTPPSRVSDRSECFTIGWAVAELNDVLPMLEGPSAMIVDARGLGDNDVLGVKVYVVGDDATGQTEVLGYNVVASQRFGTKPCAEVDVFVLRQGDESLGPG